MLTNHFGDVAGVASYSGVARKLEPAGLRVLHEGRAQPYFPLVARRSLSAGQIQSIQKALVALNDSAEGQGILKTVGIQGFDTGGQKRLGELLAWLGQ